MIQSFTNKHGVSACITPFGVLLSYALDSYNYVEVFFPSIKQALQVLQASSVDNITGIELLCKSNFGEHLTDT